MISGSGKSVRALILSHLEQSIIELGLEPSTIPDDFDLLTSGVIDSLGIVELVAAVEQQLGNTVDLSELDPESLTILGPLSRYIERQYLDSARMLRNGAASDDALSRRVGK